MTDETAIARARELFPQVKWDNAFPVLPAHNSPIESASWMVTENGPKHALALVDEAGGMLYRLDQSI